MHAVVFQYGLLAGVKCRLRGEVPERPGPESAPPGPAQDSTEVPGVTIDGWVQGLGLRKVDVEGAEWEVLEGAREGLRGFRPTLLVEVHGTWDRLTALLEEAKYTISKAERDPVHSEGRGFILARPQGEP